MSKHPGITPQELKQVFDYDPRSGSFSWATPTRSWFVSDLHWAAFRARDGGGDPFTLDHSQGYLWGSVGGELVLAHRAAWAYCHGSWPDSEIDHINHDRKDNRISNLREVDRTDNSRNSRLRSDNTSGVTGVTWDRQRGKWAAQIGLPGRKNKALGRFDTLEEAVSARKAAERLYGFHPNHGSDVAASTNP